MGNTVSSLASTSYLCLVLMEVCEKRSEQNRPLRAGEVAHLGGCLSCCVQGLDPTLSPHVCTTALGGSFCASLCLPEKLWSRVMLLLVSFLLSAYVKLFICNVINGERKRIRERKRHIGSFCSTWQYFLLMAKSIFHGTGLVN